MFHLSETSQNRLENLDPKLVQCVRRAITTTTVDFGVFEGMRSRERQAKLVREGVSRTLDSYHLTGHAVDLVPFIGGRLQWQMPACIQIAIAMREAAFTFGVEMTWGSVWDRKLVSLSPAHLDLEIEAYVARFKAKNPDKSPLIDGPHFQVAR
jgi:peptidoglycan L-alanyl-D-glutamate endopeptidase CwlK